MSTIMTRGRVKSISTSSKQTNVSSNAAALAAAIADFDVQIYGSDGKPLYELVSLYGTIAVSNTIDTAFQSFSEMRSTLKDGEAGYIYNEDFGRFTLAIKVPGSGVVFAGLLHDANGTPRVEAELSLARVKAIRDLEKDGSLIIEKGREFLKALPSPYVDRLTKAA
ncbi:MAG: hypothetical protein EOP56_19375 [Sphingobacteriales bacterium]|nr:MAG: hypothetical protein EOP56_19375 [Sphingobacteriales bacterium]